MLPLLLCFLTLHAEPAPFWKAKEKVYDRVKNGEIIVAVSSQNVKETGAPKNRLVIRGGGLTSAPAEFVYKTALNFDQLAKVSGYIKEAKFDPKAKILSITVGAFGYEGKMRLTIESHPAKSIDFKVIEGAMRGLSGTFSFAEFSPLKTEVGIDAAFRYDDFPAPKVFLEFGLEVVFQRMAARLRSFVEEEFKKGSS